MASGIMLNRISTDVFKRKMVMAKPAKLEINDLLIEDEDYCSQPQRMRCASRFSSDNYITLPNMPDNVFVQEEEIQTPLSPTTKLTEQKTGIINSGYTLHMEEKHSTDTGLPVSVADQKFTQIQLQNTIPTYNIETPLAPSKVSVSYRKDSTSSESFPAEEESWNGINKTSFIGRSIQRLVQAFAERAHRVKESIAQPPTQSPTPPSRQTQKEKEQDHPRIESSIQPDDLLAANDWMEEEKGLWCFRLFKQIIPTIPQVLDPQSKTYITWLFIVTLCYIYNTWSLFLRAIFLYQTSENLSVFLGFDYFSDAVYLIDIIVFKVRVKYLHEGFWVESLTDTRKNYMKKSMFKMDLLSLLPLDLLYLIYGFNAIFRFPRMLKVQTFWDFFNRMDAVAKSPYIIRILRTLIYMMYLIHLNACAYYAMSVWEGIGSNNWVFQGNGNAYVRCMYFATKTATSIGKNPKPENEYEYIFMTFSWLTGVFIFAFLIGQIRDIVATASQNTTQYHQVMDKMVKYMRNLNLPDDLQRRVRLWLNHTWEQQKTLHEDKILDSLPKKMKTDVAINVHYSTLVKVQLFKDCDKALLRDLVLKLKPMLILPGDYICRKGEIGKEMYIVNKGLVQVMGGETGDVVLATLSEGSVFGEISLLGIPGCDRRTADVRSKGFSNLFVLGKDDLWDALEHYPEAQSILKKKAQSLIKTNEDREKSATSSHKKTAETIIKETSCTPTPRLLKTVLQVVQPDSLCAQLLSQKRSSVPVLTRDQIPGSLTASPYLRATSVSDTEEQGVNKLSVYEQDQFLPPVMPPNQHNSMASLEKFFTTTSDDINPNAIKELVKVVPFTGSGFQTYLSKQLDNQFKTKEACSNLNITKMSITNVEELPSIRPISSGNSTVFDQRDVDELSFCPSRLSTYSMLGYDNLGFVPLDINLSCSSSVTSDETVC
ncbi:cyclic nucleotide-gated channel beta-3-like [Tachypleus tridentatus]|uniref:cyclic nucleotide-gated channel beta-3-like n=1 Tax=Tachypleus tridentatus TaxID=6853 RepID=UPI003FD2D850